MKTLLDIIRKPYYFVPPCPHCGSPITGRYLRMWLYRAEIIEDALKQGELVKPVCNKSQHRHAFCIDCGHEWVEDVPLGWLTLNEIKHQKAIRHTDDYLQFVKLQKTNRRRRSWFDLFL